MIAEVPTVAIEYAYITNNTSVIQDEVLAARIGLVPLAGDPDGFDAMTWYKKPSTGEEQQPGTIRNTLAFVLEAECTNKAGVNKNENDPAKLYNNANVYAKDIRFIPSGDQVEMFPKGLPRPQNPDILLVKMRPGQCIAMDLHAVKGIGADHAKFSPVATASYRLLPTIDIIKPIIGDDAKKFARCFPRGVIELESVTETDAKKDSEYKDHVGEKKAVVKNTFIDTVSRECLRHDEFKHKVKLGRVRDHFIYNVESTGQYDSDEIFLKSIKILHKKCDRVLKYLEKMEDEASFKELAGDS